MTDPFDIMHERSPWFASSFAAAQLRAVYLNGDWQYTLVVKRHVGPKVRQKLEGLD